MPEPLVKTDVLPTPVASPGKDVLIYDGQCSFCRSQVQRFHRLDTESRLTFISLHNPAVAADYPDLSHDHLMEQMVLVDTDGNRHSGYRALAYLTRHLPKLRWLSWLFKVPLTGPIWAAGYRMVAKRRYRLGGGRCEDGVCRV